MKAAIAGSTGFIGKLLIERLEDDETFEHVQVLSRRPIELSTKFEVLVNENIDEQKLASIDVALCALGTTIKTAGSQQAFYYVDHDLVMGFAKNSKSAGAKTFGIRKIMGQHENKVHSRITNLEIIRFGRYTVFEVMFLG